MAPRLDMFLFFAGCGVGTLLLRLYTDRTERGRKLARSFWTGWPAPRSAFMPLAPLWAAGSIALGFASHLPRLAGAWLGSIAVESLLVVMLLSYRDPPPLMPQWMLDEIESGVLPRYELGWVDRLGFAFLATLAVVGAIAPFVLIVVYHEAG